MFSIMNTAPLLACVIVITPVLLDHRLYNTQRRRHDAFRLDLTCKQTDKTDIQQEGKRESRCL
jgi:hypothetical protein